MLTIAEDMLRPIVPKNAILLACAEALINISLGGFLANLALFCNSSTYSFALGFPSFL